MGVGELGMSLPWSIPPLSLPGLIFLHSTPESRGLAFPECQILSFLLPKTSHGPPRHSLSKPESFS